MSDHWNSLADLLGTPSIDPIQKKTTPSRKSESVTDRATPESSSPPAPESHTVVKTVPEVQANADVPKTEQTSRLRSSWDTVARLFGVVPNSESNPTPIASSSPGAATNESTSVTDDDLFVGFGRKQDRSRDEESPRKTGVRESVAHDAARRPKKKPSSLWDTSNPINDEPTILQSDVATNAGSMEPVEQFKSEDDAADGMPERRGRQRNIRRGRGSEANRDVSRDNTDTPQAGFGRERIRSDVRSEDAPRRGDRSERPSEASHGSRADRAPARPVQDRATSTDRPPRESERRSRNEDREPRTIDRSNRGEKRSVDSDETSAARGVERPPRKERSAIDGDGHDRPSRSRVPRREATRVEDEGEWDSSEVGFEQDESVHERDIPPIASEDDDASAASPRRRRRRRGGRGRDSENRDDVSVDDVSGQQAYGRQASEKDETESDGVENLRIHKVTSWLDAISPMIEVNMENHKRNPGHDRSRGGGNSRRRNNGGGGGKR